ncbi:HNH endonuclease [Shewanella kaireitica]|uniref:HNH endonuclease n=1 Tax=Shewanella kaireitica TaxID=212021 RepID=UPI00200FB190|nr:HNH endonuclease [Shewanella kaireitica]MCL1095916.1 HNH endonuclease [Shewanella kaireitica]
MKKDITFEQLQTVYDLGYLFALQKTSLDEALEQLVGSLDMNQTSATNYMHNFEAFRTGRVYKRAMSALSYEIFLPRFYKDLPLPEFERVIESVELHLEYRWSKSKAKHLEVRTLVDSYKVKLASLTVSPIYPDEIPEQSTGFIEGAVKQVTINAYERDPKARAACIAKFGAICQVCKFNFETQYGEIGKGFIHVHHKVDIAIIGENYQVDPINDLIPVCPNCHAMLHTETPAMSIEKLKQIIDSANT